MLRARPDALNRATPQAAQDRPCYPVLGNYKFAAQGEVSPWARDYTGSGRLTMTRRNRVE